jgi:outer membrane receptor protein involved in Fe transport
MHSVRAVLLILLAIYSQKQLFSQNGSLQGKVIDQETGETLIGATVTIIGTYKGALTDLDGNYLIQDIKPGDYSVKFTYIGYTEKIFNGIKIKPNETTKLEVKMSSAELSIETVEIVGDKSLINLEAAKSEVRLTAEEIKDMNVTDVQTIATMQIGVNKTPDGLQIRGGRVYETQYVIDGINAQDPLAGTGFGVDIAKNAIQEVEIVTGGVDAEYGSGTSGVIATRTKEGGKKLSSSFSWQRDNFGFQPRSKMSWNTDIASFTLGGPLIPNLTKKDSTGNRPKKSYHDKLFFFTSFNAQLTDEYYGFYAKQLYSSLLNQNTFWSPRQDNRWSGTIKLTFQPKPGMKISLSTQQSLNINQNTRSLQIIGNDAVMLPGFQYFFAENLDNANTYTHKTNLTILNFRNVFKGNWTVDASIARLFTNLRADANGRPFREQTINQIYDPASIISDPITIFNPNDSIVYVNPPSGLMNNNGIATLWHDHYASEITLKTKFSYFSKNKVHLMNFGVEHQEQEYQWIDVVRPWVGAPIQINDTLTYASNRIGESNDIWKVKPATGGIFYQDEIKYKGIIATLGFRLTYWAPGKFADDAVANPNTPVLDYVRQEYQKQTVPIAGRRFKARFLPKIRISFPVTENNVLYFNYGHSTRLPHPRFLYAGLDPVYQNRSFLANLGNPNLNPETNVNYEVGLKSQLTANWAMTVTAFYNDKFDFIVNKKIVIRDQTGRFVEKSFAINQDYARIRGLEISLNRRVGNWFRGTVSGAYQIATGKSNSARESLLQIQTTGNTSATREQFLAWDRPLDLKAMFVFKSDTLLQIGNVRLKHFTLFISSTYKSGLRYTPYVFSGTDANTGRPVYEVQSDKPFSKIGSPWMWTDIRLTKDFKIFKQRNQSLAVFVELKNAFNQKNAQIINPVTGRAYEFGDPLPLSYLDPAYPNPLDRGIPPFNPARYLQPRQFFWGVSMSF